MTLCTLVNVTCIWLFWLISNVLFYAIKLDGIILWILPCYNTFHTLQEKKDNLNIFKRYLCFWMILGITLIIEYFTYVLYYYVTLYRIVRLVLIIWLSINDYENSEQLFNSFISYLSYKDVNNFIKSINYNNIVNYVNSLILILKRNYYLAHSAFKSQDKFAENVISCKTILIDDNPINFSDKFIHIDIDYSNINQVNSAIKLATTRAFQSRFVPPITDIIKGKAFGNMLVLSPTGLSKKYQFKGEYVYRGNATFRKSDNKQSDTFSCFVYYFRRCFNPIRHSNGVDSSNVKFITEVDNKTYVVNNNNLYNCLYNNIANKLQYKYLNKMTDKNKMNNIYFCDILPGSDILKISTKGPKQSCRAHFSGLLVGGTSKNGAVSVAYKIDQYSEYVGQGEYPKNSEAFPKAVGTTFDGIAIDANTRVVIYEHEYFKGKILLDAKGPKLINNVLWKKSGIVNYTDCMTDIFPDRLQENFPINVRVWSDSNMHPWSKGSVKILSNTLS